MDKFEFLEVFHRLAQYDIISDVGRGEGDVAILVPAGSCTGHLLHRARSAATNTTTVVVDPTFTNIAT